MEGRNRASTDREESGLKEIVGEDEGNIIDTRRDPLTTTISLSLTDKVNIQKKFQLISRNTVFP